MGITRCVVGEEIVKIIVATRKRAAICEDIARQFAERAIIRQKRHATSGKKSL
jgi:hypothetical protein